MFGARDPESLKRNGFCIAFAGIFVFGFWLSDWRYGFEASCLAKVPIYADDVPPMPTITTPEEFDVALKSRRCVIFVDADWSPTAVMGRRVIYPIVRSMKRFPNNFPVSFFRLDVTTVDDTMEQKLVSMPVINWFSGSGQVLLIHNMDPVNVVESAANETHATVLERVQRLAALDVNH